jgi:hypothetical protein
VPDLLVSTSPEDGGSEVYEREVVVEDVAYRVRFRLPNGADLEAVAELATADPEAGARAILRQCLVDVERCDNASAAELPASAWRELSAPMAALDPQAEIDLDLVCPACGLGFGAILDAGTYLLREVDARLARLFQDIHTLALHYHWSEREIREMPQERRRRYLELLAEPLASARRQ